MATTREHEVVTTTTTARTPATSTSPAPATSLLTEPSSLPRHDIDFASPLSTDGREHLDINHDDDVPPRYRRVDDLLGLGCPPGQAERDLEERLLLACDVKPTSLAEAMQHKCWRHAMLDEMTSIEASGTWKLADPPTHIRPIGL